MRFPHIFVLASIYVRTSLGGTLQVIDYGTQCAIWSTDNHGCTGYSASFGAMKGDECPDLTEVIDGAQKDVSVLTVDACGTENGEPAAWIQVEKTGKVTFVDQMGTMSACTLSDGFKVGSWCTSEDIAS